MVRLKEFFDDSVKPTLIDNYGIKPNNNCKCPYCSTKYGVNGFPLATITLVDDMVFEPNIKTQIHDMRQEFKCLKCGAPINFNAQCKGPLPAPRPPSNRINVC